MQPTIMLATLCLNEMEWLPKLYEQHKDWPGLVGWVFVESADRMYAIANPNLVTPEGLSVDGTSEFLKELALKDERVQYCPFGFSSNPDPAQGKVDSRNQYASAADAIDPDYIMVVDADEFYCMGDQPKFVDYMAKIADRNVYGFVFRQREIWRPPSIVDQPLFNLEVKHGLWSITHCRGWKWRKGLRYYADHNHLEHAAGQFKLRENAFRFDSMLVAPEYIHMGFASSATMRNAKNRYYVTRGEGFADGRDKYVTCRDAFRVWKPGMVMPHHSAVVTYNGPVPEVFCQKVSTDGQ